MSGEILVSSRSTNEMWQNNVPRHPNNGGWSLIMCATKIIAQENTTHEEALRADDFRMGKIDHWGDVPEYFARAWLTDYGKLYRWFVMKHPDWGCEIDLAAIKSVWVRSFPRNADLSPHPPREWRY